MKTSSDNGSSVRAVLGEKRRLNLKLDEDLLSWAFSYAVRNRTTVTQLISDFFRDLRRREEARRDVDAEQI